MGTLFLTLVIGVLIWQGISAIGRRELAKRAATDAELRLKMADLIFDATHKKCPRCAEMVKAEALACRYCGNEFPAPPPELVRVSADHPLPPPSATTLSECLDLWRDRRLRKIKAAS